MDKKVNSWSGSIEVGITSTDPDHLSRLQPFPSSANELRQGIPSLYRQSNQSYNVIEV